MRITPDDMYEIELTAYYEMLENYERAIAAFDPCMHLWLGKPSPPARYISPSYGAHKPSTSRRGEKRRTRKERFGS